MVSSLFIQLQIFLTIANYRIARAFNIPGVTRVLADSNFLLKLKSCVTFGYVFSLFSLIRSNREVCVDLNG